MGKVRAAKKRKAESAGAPDGDRNRTGPGQGGESFRETLSISELENNLGALEEIRRKQACSLLADLYQFNVVSKGSLDILASKKVLMKLGMRLIDSSHEVKVAATLALKNLTDSGDKSAISRVVGFGMFRTAISLAMEAAKQPLGELDLFPTQNLLYVIANILDAIPEAAQEILKYHRAFLSFLFSCLSIEGVQLSLVNTVANVLNVVVRTPCLPAIADTDAQALQAFLNRLVVGKVVLQGNNSVSIHGLAPSEYDQWVIIIQLMQVLVHWHSRGASPAVQAALLPFPQVLQTLLAILDALLADPSLATAAPDVGIISLLETVLDVLDSFADHLSEQAESLCAAASEPSPALSSLLSCVRTCASLSLPQYALTTLLRLRDLFQPHLQPGPAALPTAPPCTHVTSAGLQLLSLMERAASLTQSALHLLPVLSQLDPSSEGQALASSHLRGELDTVWQHLAWLLDAVQATTSSASPASSQPSWVAGSEDTPAQAEEASSLKTTVLTIALLFWEVVQELCLSWALGDKDLKELTAHGLRWLPCPHVEVVVAVSTALTSLLSRPEVRLPVSYHLLWSNAWLHRARQPTALPSARKSAPGVTQRETLQHASLLVLDLCVNILMDLHASDDPEYHANAFLKLNLAQNLAELGQDLQQRYCAVRGKLCSAEDCDKVEETLLNLDNFLQYKQSARA